MSGFQENAVSYADLAIFDGTNCAHATGVFFKDDVNLLGTAFNVDRQSILRDAPGFENPEIPLGIWIGSIQDAADYGAILSDRKE